MEVVAEALLVLSAVTAAVVPKLRLTVVSFVVSAVAVEVPILPLKDVRFKVFVVIAVEDVSEMLPEALDKVIACIEEFPRLPVTAIAFEPASLTARFCAALPTLRLYPLEL